MGRVVWSPELEQGLAEAVRSAEERGQQRLDALREFAAAHGLSEQAVATRYYRYVKRRGVPAPERQRPQGTSAPASAAGRWTEEQRRELFEMVEALRNDGGKSLDQIIKEVQRELYPDRSVFSVRSAYQRERRRRALGRASPSPTPLPALRRAEQSSQQQPQQTDLLDSLSRLADAALRIDGVQIEAVMGGLARLAELATRAAEADGMRVQINQLQEQLKDRDAQIAELKSRLETYLKELKAARRVIDSREQVLETANALLEEFASFQSVEKVARLAEFRNRLRTTLDQFGNVVSAVNEWKERFDQLMMSELGEPATASSEEEVDRHGEQA